MGTIVRAWGTRLPDPYNYSILGGAEHPSVRSDKEVLFSEREFDDKGREVAFHRWKDNDREQAHYSRETEYGLDGKKLRETEYFDESGSTVVHKIARTAEGEVETVEYDGELESTYERSFHPDGRIRAERLLDAEGEPVELGEWDAEGRLVRNETPDKVLELEYEGNIPVRRCETIGETETVETVELEGGRPARSLVLVDGEEASRKTWTYEGRKVTVEERDLDGDLVSRNVDELDEAGRPLYREEFAERESRVFMRSIWRNEYWPDGRFKQSVLERTIVIERAPPRPYRNGFRQATWDEAGRMKELLLSEWREDDFEENSYYRFEYEERE